MKESASPSPLSRRRHLIGAALLLLALTLVSFSPILKNGFVNWDDDVYVTENPLVRGATLASIPEIFTSLDRVQYKPVVFLFFAVEYRLFGLNPKGYHAVSLVLHALNTLLVFAFFILLRGDPLIAFGVAALFGVHPLRVESVAWVTEQKDLLVGLFFLMAGIAYLVYRQKGRRAPYYFSLVFFCLSLLTKPMAVMFPFILAGIDGFFPRQGARRTLWDKVPFLTVSVSVVLINDLALRWLDLRHAVSFSVADIVYRLSFYISKVLLPSSLSGFYPAGAERAPVFLATAAAALGLCVFLCVRKRLSGTLFFGLMFFAMALAPVLLIGGSFVVADRYVYVASLGIFFIAWELGAAIASRKPALIALGFVVGLFSCLSFQRCAVWRDGVALWEDVLAQYPRSTVARLNAGSAHYSRGDDEQARRHARALLALEPDSWDGLLLLGNVDLRQKRYAEAEGIYGRVLRLNPASCGAANGLGLAAYAQGRLPEAVGWYRKAVQLNPSSFQSAVNLADAYLRLGDKTAAIVWLREAVSLKTDDVSTWGNLSILLFEEKRYGECLDALKRLLALTPKDAGVYRDAGVILEGMGFYDAARSMFENAEKINLETLRLSTAPAERFVQSSTSVNVMVPV